MSLPHPSEIDPETIENLRALCDPGDDGFLKEIIGIYLNDTPRRLADLRAAAAKGDTALYTRAAHTIKGSSSNIGALQVKALAEKIERSPGLVSPGTPDPLVLELEQAFERAAAGLRSIIG